jgi:hypothetical protein
VLLWPVRCRLQRSVLDLAEIAAAPGGGGGGSTLSGGAIAGIVIASVLVVALTACLAILVWRERRGKPVCTFLHEELHPGVTNMDRLINIHEHFRLHMPPHPLDWPFVQVFVPFHEDENRRIITNAQLSSKHLDMQLGERGSPKASPQPPV